MFLKHGKIYCCTIFFILLLHWPMLVRANHASAANTCIFQFNNTHFSCSYGRSGLTDQKKEGDGATPIGDFYLRKIFYRPDRIHKNVFHTSLPLQAIQKNDGWCDEVNSPFYNCFIKLPFKGSYEPLWREDHLYDIVVVVGYNDHPIKKNKGSAIFLHIRHPQHLPTSGCIALTQDNLLTLLRGTTPASVIHIGKDTIKLITPGIKAKNARG